jgi:1-deoxy-D-xylulose-5-phosphate synthase
MMTARDALVADLARLTPARVRAASPAELTDLAAKIRQFIIDTTPAAAPATAASLGTIELTLALHRVFQSPEDRIIWDTGHQAYAHKIVTGRIDRFRTLNTYGGMSPYVTRLESEHDVVDASHRGTALSVALGAAFAKALSGDTRSIVAVVNGEALAEGVAFEALNHAATATYTNLVIVVNDSGAGAGALRDYLASLSPERRDPEALFTSFGLDYIGPIDGHAIGAVVAALERARSSTQIPLVHVRTETGRGSKAAADRGKPHDAAPARYPDAVAPAIADAMTRDERIVAIVPGAREGAAFQALFTTFPDRTFDPGFAEQHAMTLAAGFALEQCLPVVIAPAPALQRAFDALMRDVCFGNLPVLVIALDHGFAGRHRPTEHAIYDAVWRSVPNLRVMAPKDRFELDRMIADRLGDPRSPVMILVPEGLVDEVDPGVTDETLAAFRLPQTVLDGRDMTILSVGRTFAVARPVAEHLRAHHIDCGLVNLRYLHPLPYEPLAAILARAPRLLTIEESVVDSGVGTAIAAFALDHRIRCDVLRLGSPNAFVAAGSRDELYGLTGLDRDSILDKIAEFWNLEV